jgi:hypothetical protein
MASAAFAADNSLGTWKRNIEKSKSRNEEQRDKQIADCQFPIADFREQD